MKKQPESVFTTGAHISPLFIPSLGRYYWKVDTFEWSSTNYLDGKEMTGIDTVSPNINGLYNQEQTPDFVMPSKEECEESGNTYYDYAEDNAPQMTFCLFFKPSIHDEAFNDNFGGVFHTREDALDVVRREEEDVEYCRVMFHTEELEEDTHYIIVEQHIHPRGERK